MPNGETILTLDVAAQKLVGLRIEPVRPAKLNPELKGYGRVLDPAPLLALVTELATAQTTLTASQKEFDRLKTLNEQKNVSDRALQAAEAAARRDQILLESIRTRLVLSWSEAVAGTVDLPGFVRSLTSFESALVRIDLPAGELVKTLPAGARIAVLSAEDNLVPAQLLGPAPNVDPQVQGQGFLFLVKASPLRLVPGTATQGYLQFPGGSLTGFIIPNEAVVRHAGHGWIYLQTSNVTFTRRAIALNRRIEEGWFISEGVVSNDPIVIRGAQALLSEEEKYQIKMLE